MSRKREPAGGETWAQRVELRRVGAELVDAPEEEIAARAATLGVDAGRLRAFVFEARRRTART